jgi:hypothetical protein
MRIDIHIHMEPGSSEILSRLDELKGLIILEKAQMAQIDDELTQLTADVAAEQGAVDSAVVLINGISAKIDAAVAAATAAGATPAELQALTDLSTSVNAQTASLSTAVAANP